MNRVLIHSFGVCGIAGSSAMRPATLVAPSSATAIGRLRPQLTLLGKPRLLAMYLVTVLGLGGSFVVG